MSLRPTIRLLFPLACLLSLLTSAHAQGPTYHPPIDPHNIVLPNLNHPADITASWLIHQGDDPAYASPTLDDSQWTVIDITKPLSTYGIVKPNFVWYRTHVHVPSGQRHLALLLRLFVGSEQIYVNGVTIGPSIPFDNQGGRIFANFDIESLIPDNLVASGDVTIAIRAQIEAASRPAPGRTSGFQKNSFFLLGDASVLSDRTSLYTFRGFTPSAVLIALGTLVLLIALGLALTLRSEPEYLALCFFLTATVAVEILNAWRFTHHVAFTRFYDLPSQLCTATIVFSGIAFARGVLRLPNSRWIRAYQWVIGSLMIIGATIDAVTFQVHSPNQAWLLLVLFTILLIVVPLNLGLPIFALWIWRRTRNFDALLLSVPLLIQALFFYIQIAVLLVNLLHLKHKLEILPPPVGSFDVQWSEVTDFLFLLALLAFLILRTVRLARARAALAAELAAAQQVQQLLLTGSSRPTPGFLVETAFHPAAQVGGDFFLLSPFEDGSLLAIVGDVSGKGLTAAMRVAMILGILRRETSRDPAAVLANLNDALLSQSEMGFTTALCVHLFPNGTFTAANAGHIAPYINGLELETPPALPLGLAPDQFYDFITGTLAPTQTMVLLSDGVPEARNPQRELYGFDRLPNLTLLTASEIANTALRFGQEDDITVLTLTIA